MNVPTAAKTAQVVRQITPGMWNLVMLAGTFLTIFLIVDAIRWKFGGDQTFSEWAYLMSRSHWWFIPAYVAGAILLGLHFFL